MCNATSTCVGYSFNTCNSGTTANCEFTLTHSAMCPFHLQEAVGWLKNTLSWWFAYDSCVLSGAVASISQWTLCPFSSLSYTSSQLTAGLTSMPLLSFARVVYAPTDGCLAATGMLYATTTACVTAAVPILVRLKCPLVSGQPPALVHSMVIPPAYGARISLQNVNARGKFLCHCGGVVYAVSVTHLHHQVRVLTKRCH